MKAVVFHSYGSADVLEIAEVDPPSTGAGDILVRVRAAAVNPKDTFIRKGYFKELTGPAFPLRTGFDFSGEIAALGRQVQGFEPGQAVFGMIGGWQGGTFAEYIAVKPENICHKPQNLSFTESAALPLVSLTSLQALRDEAQISRGFRVCINGASGGVGSMAVQVAKIFDTTVTAISSGDNHPFLSSLGADICIDYHHRDIVQSGQLFDIFFDVFGNRLFNSIQPILSARGTWVSTVLRPEVRAAVEQTRNSSGQKAKQVFVRPDPDDLEAIRLWAEQGRIRPVLQGVFALDRIVDAHLQQETKHTRGKIVVEIP